uniref:Tripartite motif-containing protein 16-like n=1 Tax=Sparus aurata TaxID=8175 RepID=A0A671WBJ6_SPAAU
MAQKAIQLDRETFSCSVCLDQLKDPVTIPCGHSYCKNCINGHWDTQDEMRIYSCPQCRKSFTPRPELVKNTMLAALVEDWWSRQRSSRRTSALITMRELEGSRHNIQQRIQDREEDVKLLQQEVEAINGSADKAVEHSEKIFTQLIRLMEERRSDVKQQVRSQQETEVSRVKELQEKLEQEITELKRKDAELKKLSHTEDHNQFLHNYPSLSALSESTYSSSIKIRPLKYFEDVTAAVSEVRDKLQDVLRETGTNISLTETQVDILPSQPEKKTRAEFLRYSRKIKLDPNTAYRHLLLSERNRKATYMNQQQSYSDHPDRFTLYYQVLSRESLTGRCYWEMELRGRGGGRVRVAVAYKNIRRAGKSHNCGFGFNDKSWALGCDNITYEFSHNNIQTPVSGPLSSRVGVYLDHSAGILSFYSVSDTMTLLHRVRTTFTQPLYAGLFLSGNESTDISDISEVRRLQRAQRY